MQLKEEMNKRVKVTDDDAIKELKTFMGKTDNVTVQIRHCFWVTQFITMIIAITLIYLFSFGFDWQLDLQTENTKRVIFAAYLGGIYTTIDSNDF